MKKLAVYGAYAGLVLIIASLLNFATGQVWNLLSTITGAVGALLLIVFFIMRFDVVKKTFSLRSVKYGGNTLAVSIILLCILGLINFVANRHSVRADLTSGGQFSLSKQTVQILRNLDKEVRVTGFFQSDQQREMEDLLDSYRFYSSKLRVEFVDPDKKPAIAKQYGVTAYNTTVFECGDKVERITEQTEQSVTNALIKVTREGKKTIYFLVGHGENDIDDTERTGYSAAKTAIEAENYQVEKLLLAEKKSVPGDCAILIISGPRHPLFQAEIDSIQAYLERGGKAFFLLDPEPSFGFRDMMKEYGLLIGNDVVLDVSGVGQLFGMGPSIPLVNDYETHPITKDFRVMTFFPLARSVSVMENPPEGITVQKLFSTSANSWGETNVQNRQASYDEGVDLKGPVTLGAVASKDKMRVVVVGDSDFGNNAYLDAQGNRDLFLNIVSWLAEEEDLISIRPKTPEDRRINMTAKQARWVMYLTVILMPLAALIVGIAIYIKRERR